MSNCPFCNCNYREPEGEYGEHECPRCGRGHWEYKTAEEAEQDDYNKDMIDSWVCECMTNDGAELDYDTDGYIARATCQDCGAVYENKDDAWVVLSNAG